MTAFAPVSRWMYSPPPVWSKWLWPKTRYLIFIGSSLSFFIAGMMMSRASSSLFIVSNRM